MISLEEFKKLIPKDRDYTEEEIEKLRDNQDKMAELFFKMWLEDRKKAN